MAQVIGVMASMKVKERTLPLILFATRTFSGPLSVAGTRTEREVGLMVPYTVARTSGLLPLRKKPPLGEVALVEVEAVARELDHGAGAVFAGGAVFLAEDAVDVRAHFAYFTHAFEGEGAAPGIACLGGDAEGHIAVHSIGIVKVRGAGLAAAAGGAEVQSAEQAGGKGAAAAALQDGIVHGGDVIVPRKTFCSGTALLHLDANTPSVLLTVVAEEGQTGPGGGTWIALDGNSSDPRLSANGDLGFIGWEKVGTSQIQGIYSRLNTTAVGTSGAVVQGRVGSTAPGTSGATFNGRGQVVDADGIRNRRGWNGNNLRLWANVNET